MIESGHIRRGLQRICDHPSLWLGKMLTHCTFFEVRVEEADSYPFFRNWACILYSHWPFSHSKAGNVTRRKNSLWGKVNQSWLQQWCEQGDCWRLAFRIWWYKNFTSFLEPISYGALPSLLSREAEGRGFVLPHLGMPARVDYLREVSPPMRRGRGWDGGKKDKSGRRGGKGKKGRHVKWKKFLNFTSFSYVKTLIFLFYIMYFIKLCFFYVTQIEHILLMMLTQLRTTF